MVQQTMKPSDFMRNMMEKACREHDKKPSNRVFSLSSLSTSIMRRVGMKGTIPNEKLKLKLKDRSDIRVLKVENQFELLDLN